jgi:hypothetical protein
MFPQTLSLLGVAILDVLKYTIEHEKKADRAIHN